jgi:drug/metabolite transporter (DMT)-like permease
MPKWLTQCISAAVLWGVWGALIEIPQDRLSPPIPASLSYVAWSITMVACGFALWIKTKKPVNVTRAAVLYGLSAGILGAGGQLLLFLALRHGPAYVVFPLISLSPLISVLLAFAFLGERVDRLGSLGVGLAIIGIVLLSMQEPGGERASGHVWFLFSIATMIMWGLQAYYFKSSQTTIESEDLFLYMAASAILLSPLAILITDFSLPISRTAAGWGLVILIQSANSLGAFLSVLAIRSGKAIIVIPALNGLFPVITVILSLLIYQRLPYIGNTAGIALAIAAIFLMSIGEARQSSTPSGA